MMRGRELAYDALVTVLKGINGSVGGYRTNLEGRVLERLILPEDGVGIEFPYVCLPYVDTAPDPEHDQHQLIDVWTQWVFGFVAETQTDAGKAGSARLLMRLEGDIKRAILLNPTLAGTVQDVSLAPGGTSIAAVEAGDDYGEVSLPLRLKQWVDAAALAAA